MINSKDISVVVQGAIIKNQTDKCLNSIREFLPKAEIILSTWNDSDVKGLDYDILVENKDPGAIIFDFSRKLYNNVNRQLVSTQNGLKLVSRKYVLKLRTDFYLKGNDFLNYWDNFPKVDNKWKLFNHRVIIHSVFSRIYSDTTEFPMPFHASDFFFFGETEDIKSYFLNTSLMPKKDLADYNYIDKSKSPYSSMTWRMAPEQYYCFSFVQQFYDVKFEDWTDWNNDNFNISNNFMINNFIFLGSNESGIYSDKHSIALDFEKNIKGAMTHEKFLEEYSKIFD